MEPVDVLSTATIAGRYGIAWNDNDLDAIMALQGEDMVFRMHAGGFGPAVGAEAVRAHFAFFFDAWADLRFTTVALHVADDLFTNQYRVSARLVKPFPLQGKVMEPNGRRVDVEGADVITVRGGLVRTKDTYLDTLALHHQLTGE